jgi:NitT/TauT family transport system ATP-binding protein
MQQVIKSVFTANTPPGIAKVRLDNVGKTYAERAEIRAVEVLADINITVDEGEFVSLVGPSGCGKSTILKLISGLVSPSRGSIRVDGSEVSGPALGIGFMFQRDALLPWATVAENISIGLDLGRYPGAQRHHRLAELIQLVGLEGFEEFYPNSLSGGMRHRVSLARTLAYDPSLFLMDEPFGALDAHTKIILGSEFLRIWSKHRRTALFVTHDIAEAITMSDRVIVMSSRPGKVVAQFHINLPRPRDFVAVRGTERYSTLYQEIWAALMNGNSGTQPDHPIVINQ